MSGYQFHLAPAIPTHDGDTALRVTDTDGTTLGYIRGHDRSVVHGLSASAAWRVVDAGLGVEVSPVPHASPVAAAEAIAATRAANPEPLTADTTGLTGFERDVLDHETRYAFTRPAVREAAAAEAFPSVPRTLYYQTLNALLDSPAAAVYAAQTVNRLRRIRDTYRAARPIRRGVA